MSTGSVQNDRTPQGSAAAAKPAAVPAASGVAPGVAAEPIDWVLAPGESAADRLQRFLREPSTGAALQLWFGFTTATAAGIGKQEIVRRLGRDVARLDDMLTRQVNRIIHHRRFQQLESSWRGLQFLVDQLDEAENVKIRALDVSWRELARDFERAIEFDQSQLFRKLYSEEFGMSGGEPFGVLLGDYEIRPRPCAEHPFDDMEVLRGISGVAAAAFTPFIAAAHPAMFGLDDFSRLQQPLNLPATFDQLEYLKWRAFRETEDARFVGLTLPRVLMRLPYEDDGSRVDGFAYREDVDGPGRDKYLWGNAAFAFGAVLIRSFAESGWLADIRGFRRDVAGGGLVTGLPVHSFSTDAVGVAPKCSTDVIITDNQEKELSELGFLPLCRCPDTEYSVFYATQSVQKPKQYDELEVTINARISAMLQYTFCVSLLAHYLKVLARGRIGSFSGTGELEDFLYRWLQQYVTSDSEASTAVKAELPLREASVRVREHPGKPGSFVCVAHLWPHFELDELATTLKITTELTPEQSA